MRRGLFEVPGASHHKSFKYLPSECKCVDKIPLLLSVACKIAAPAPYTNTGIALAVTKDWAIFRDICQKVFDDISQEEKTQIRQKWIAVQYYGGFSWSKAIFWLVSLISVFSILLLLFWWWNRTLKKEIKFRNISEQRLNNSISRIGQQNKEKEILIQEIHHRVKNNLQVIMSMIRLQSNLSNNKEVINSLNQATDRIRTISLIHEKIYSSSDLGHLIITDYVNSLANEIISNFSEKNIKLNINSDLENLNLKSIVPLALILNELITNSLKYGFKTTKQPEISIDFTTNITLKMRYHDNGVWFENPHTDNFGTSLVEIFTEQLDGSFELKKLKSGTEYLFDFKSFG